MVHVNQEHLDRIAESPATVLCQQDWFMQFVVMVDVNRDNPDQVVEPPATVLCHQDWIMLFVVKGSAKVVNTKTIVVKTVTVWENIFVRVLLILQNVIQNVIKTNIIIYPQFPVLIIIFIKVFQRLL